MDFLRFPIVLACSLLALQTLIAVPTAVALTGHRQPEEGELLWQDQLNRGGDFGTAVAVQGKRVFAAGFSQSLTTEDTDFVRAYDARTGRLLWERQSPKRGNSEDVLLAVEGYLVFATLSNHIRAHDVRTGAVVWQDALGAATITDVSAKQGMLVVVGYRFDGNVDVLVRAYDAATGELIWDDRFNSGGNNEDRAFAVALAGRRVFVAGETLEGGTGLRSFLLRAYNSRKGDLLWDDSSPGSSTTAFAVVSHGGIVAIAGTRNLEFGANPLIRAYDARDGVLRWEHEVPGGTVPTNGFFDALAVQGHRVFAAGSRGGFLVQAYDFRSGTPLWQRQSQAAFGVALAITASHGSVYAAGLDDRDWLVEAYDGTTGDIMWEDRFDNGGLFGIARDDEAGRGRLFVVGDVQTPTDFNDFLIRAYATDRDSGRKARHSGFPRHFKVSLPDPRDSVRRTSNR